MNYSDRADLQGTMRRLGICVIVPTYNNAGTLYDVVSKVLEYTSDVIVVNDGSTDGTASVLDSIGGMLTVVSHPVNRGKGAALKTGFSKAIEMGYEYAVTIDSDGQHYASDLPLFVKAVAENRGALIVGERDLSNVDISGKSSFANRFSNFWFNLQTGCRLRDTQTGYRAYPLRKLHGLSLLTSRYEAELELLVFASWHGVPIVSIPIHVYYPPRSERVSHFRPGLDFTRISVLNTLLCCGAVLYGLPVRIGNAVYGKRLFNREFTFFTRRHGEIKEASVTLGRLFRSVYGITYFSFWSMAVFTPFVYLYFSIGSNTERKKLRFHKMLRWISGVLTRKFPGATTDYDNPYGEDFERPAMIVCNHQSHLDIPVLMAMHPRLIFLTNDWAWNNPFYRGIIQNADFLPVSAGMDAIIPQLKDLKDRGYSIVIFPEGTRSADCSILRFHQGAFMLARELGLDIVPMVLHGAGHYLPKKDFMFRRGEITLKVLKRIPFGSHEGIPLRQVASMYRKMIREEYDCAVSAKETTAYFRSLVLYKYAYRGWSLTSRCKKVLRECMRRGDMIDGMKEYGKVRILNSGIGVFAIIFALVHKNTEVIAFESDMSDSRIAASTGGIPSNLRFVHAVWNSGFEVADCDLTITLGCERECVDFAGGMVNLSFKS